MPFSCGGLVYPNVTRWLGVVVLVNVMAGVAWAHPKVDEGRMYFEEADFEKALAALADAEAADNLTRAELVELLRLRVLVNLGMGDMNSVTGDLERLLSLEPEYALGEEVPPEVHEQAAKIRKTLTGPIAVDAVAKEEGGTVRVSAASSYDPASLIRRIVVAARPANGEWERADGEAPTLTVGPSERTEYYAEALGPGGAIVAKDGSWNEPNVFAEGLPGGGEEEQAEEEGGGPGVALWATLGVGAAVAVGVVVGVLVAGGGTSDATQPSVPMVIR